jgi:molybdenum-dependent DNA-binding transcriptional regulator ModE
VAELIAERDRLIALLSTLPVAGSVGEGGRSISVSRSDVIAQIRELNELITETGGPFVIHSGGAPGY